MIKALLDKIGGLLEKEFLFGSFLPALIFAAACIATIAPVLGFDASLSWMAHRGPIDKVMYPIVAAVAIIVFAYVLSGIRPLTQRFWNGEAFPIAGTPLGNLLTAYRKKQFLEKREELDRPNQWGTIDKWLIAEARKKWDRGTQTAHEDEVEAMLVALAGLNCNLSCDVVKQTVREKFLDKLEVYSSNSLSPVYTKLRRKFLDWEMLAQIDLNTVYWQLDQNYGSLRIRPTRLGNVTMAYNSYPFVRYGMEPQLFWPHLQTQLDTGCREALGDAQTLLDFALNVATLGTLYCFLAVFAGPWLDFSALWLFLAPAAAVIAFTGYQVAVFTSERLGALVRASFDLYRLNLLAALHREPPADIEKEHEMWREISQLMLYGYTTTNFKLTPVAPAAPTVGGAA